MPGILLVAVTLFLAGVAQSTAAAKQAQAPACVPSPGALNVRGVPGDAFSYAFWSDGNTTFDVTLDWGDGTTDTGTVVPANTQSNPVTFRHTYASPGTFNLGFSSTGTFANGSSCADSTRPLGTATITGPQQPPESCGVFESLGTANLTAGDGITYTLDTRDAAIDSGQLDWGDGTATPIGVPANTSLVLPQTPPHTYTQPGTYQLALVNLRGHFPDGTPCVNDRVDIGTVVVAAPPSQGKQPTSPARPPSITISQQKCDRVLRRAGGRLGRIYRRARARGDVRTSCRRAVGTVRPCRVVIVHRPCGCRYIVRLRVPATGKARIVRVARRPGLRAAH